MRRKAVAAGLALALFFPAVSAYAQGKTIRNAYSPVLEEIFNGYNSGYSWSRRSVIGTSSLNANEEATVLVTEGTESITPFLWESEFPLESGNGWANKDTGPELYARLSSGYQYEAFESICESIIEQLRLDLDDFDSYGFDTEDSPLAARVFIGSPLSYSLRSSKIVRLALEQIGTGENDIGFIYNTGLDFSRDMPWAASFLCWLAQECEYADGKVFPESPTYSITKLYRALSSMHDAYDVSDTVQWGDSGESGYKIVPGDIVFWKNAEIDDDRLEYIHCGIVTHTENGAVLITQGNTYSGKVIEAVGNPELNEGLANGKVVHVVYPQMLRGDAYDAVRQYCLEVLKLNRAATCGVLGNLMHESGLISSRLEGDLAAGYELSAAYTEMVDSGQVSQYDFTHTLGRGCYSDLGLIISGNGGYGLVGWTYPSRKEALYQKTVKYGTSISDPTMQMAYIYDELTGSHNDTLNYLRNVSDDEQGVYDATLYWQVNYEKGTNFAARYNYAMQFWGEWED